MATHAIEGMADQAWLLKPTSSSPRYSVRIDGGAAGQSAIEEGHWVIVLEEDDKVSAISRILRIRSDLDGTTIHFDHWDAVDPSVLLASLGLTAPTGRAARLPWASSCTSCHSSASLTQARCL